MPAEGAVAVLSEVGDVAVLPAVDDGAVLVPALVAGVAEVVLLDVVVLAAAAMASTSAKTTHMSRPSDTTCS